MLARTLQTILILSLGLSALTASADDRFDNRYRYTNGTSLQWQLGTFRGGYQGYDIMFRSPGSRGWARAPGRATALGDGWVLCTDRHTGGYGIYRWSSYGWVRMPGAAVLIGGSYHQPWVINDRNIRYVWNGHDWREAGIANSNRFNSRDQYSRFDKQNDE